MRNILKSKLRNENRILNHRELILEKISAANTDKPVERVGVIEFHPSDICDLNCFYCTYRSAIRSELQEERIFPFRMLGKITELEPKAIVIVGGGEPVLYKDGNRTFCDLVNYLSEHSSDLKLGLATNGTAIPEGEWMKHIQWVRVSVDAAQEKTFLILKDGNYSDRLDSILRYLEGPIENVGLGFLYNRFNFDEIPTIIENTYEYVTQNIGLQYTRKLNIQFRPTCPIESCDCPSKIYGEASVLMTPDLHEWWKERIRIVYKEIQDLKHKGLDYFINNNTNIYDITIKNAAVPLSTFRKCYVSLIRWIIRPNGDVYPCVMKASNKGAKIGNILRHSGKDLTNNMYRFYTLDDGYCAGVTECCRMIGKLNEIVRDNLYTSECHVDIDDPFF